MKTDFWNLCIKVLLACLSMPACLLAQSVSITPATGAPPAPGLVQIVPITLEYAETPQQISWGLMKRPFIPDNHGLMIIYPEPIYASIWMFNTYINLSVAFLDANKVIRELHDLNANPEAMDPSRPVNSFWDMSKYKKNDWIRNYFYSRRTVAKIPTSYVFEMNQGWFKNQGFPVGSVIVWQPFSFDGFVMRTWDIGSYNPKPKQPVLIDPESQYPTSVWNATSSEARDIVFLKRDNSVALVTTLAGGAHVSDLVRPVLYTAEPIDKVVVAIAGELVSTGIQPGDTLIIKEPD